MDLARTDIHLDEAWVAPSCGQTIAVRNPAIEEVLASVPAGTAADDEEAAVAVANDSRYGLAGAVWSADEQRAVRVARRIRTGAVDINGAPFNPLAPFGGYKQSSPGRELGRYALDEFLQTKAIQR
ncbi:aldehyde dehydrogenase family protein [Micromonospora tulbaghiae]|uniref:aldehyde dehydrogenase family protein n=1 Tax=Micromonospora tulbaghiae TaxID=479978 RepID=UPI003F4D6909